MVIGFDLCFGGTGRRHQEISYRISVKIGGGPQKTVTCRNLREHWPGVIKERIHSILCPVAPSIYGSFSNKALMKNLKQQYPSHKDAQ